MTNREIDALVSIAENVEFIKWWIIIGGGFIIGMLIRRFFNE